MHPLLIIKTGSTFPELAARLGDFDAWVAAGLKGAAFTVSVDHDQSLPPHAQIGGVVITGSPAMVTEQSAWMQTTADWLRTAVDTGLPVLGICFGHQLLAWALGGDVGWNPRGREIGTVPVRLTSPGENDPLLGALPPSFPAHVTHRQSVLRLPDGARLLASSEREPHQAFAVGATAWGVQFHPEFSAAAMRGYLEQFAAELVGEGFDTAGLHRDVQETPAAATVLTRFATFCQKSARVIV